MFSDFSSFITLPILFFFVVNLFSCSNAQKKTRLNSFSFNKKSIIQIELPGELREISGLTTAPGNRLFCHNDEKGKIFELDINSGNIKKEIYLGKWYIEADFEGIAFANSKFYLVTSAGELYEFEEPAQGNIAEYGFIKTGLSAKFNVEGLCYDSLTNSLLLACKEYAGKHNKNNKAIFSFSLDTYKLDENPRYFISLVYLKNEFGAKSFYPSGIEIYPDGKSFFVLSAKGTKAIAEIDRQGELVDFIELKDSIHRQPEGITFLSDGTMIISDEASGKKSTLTFYRNKSKE